MIEADQRRRLAATVSHATRHVPYYRETMDRLGLVPADFATAADLARLPLLERLEVQRNPQRFVSDAQPIERYVPLKTGGSSGQPLTVYYDHFALVHVDLNPVRIVDDDSREVPDGESGEVVISNLVSRGSILLNYRLGDIARKLPIRCPCGRSLPLLSFVEGRVGDWMQTRSGERMHQQAVRVQFSDEDEVWRYQVVQHSLTHFAIAVPD